MWSLHADTHTHIHTHTHTHTHTHSNVCEGFMIIDEFIVDSWIDEVGQERAGEGGSQGGDEANETRLCG
jgi:hypothetical protein